MKKVLGLDLGTTSIGWAYILESDDPGQSSIVDLGVRIIPLTTDEQTNFEKGKPVSINADRTLKRGARRNLQRFKLRRKALHNILLEQGFITPDTVLAEDGKQSTHSIYMLRAAAAEHEISKEELARVLMMLNKKRGYKSSRKARNEEEGQIIDGMSIAKKLYEENLTPGQLCLQLLKDKKRNLPDFYRSDLNQELDRVWAFQQKYHPDILTEEFKKEIRGKGQRATAASFWGKYKFNTAENKGSRDERKLRAYEWRSAALETPLDREVVAFVISEINGNIQNSSGYLGEISDRSKELFFNRETVGQYLYRKLSQSQHFKTKGQVFYRQDYLDEFERIWATQSKYHAELTPSLKEEIRDIIIFYQRKPKSQRNLISLCEFEKRIVTKIVDGKEKVIETGSRVIPKSSPLFQEFKIWQNLHHLRAKNKKTKEELPLDQDAKNLLFDELNVKGNLSKQTALSLLGLKPSDWDINFTSLEGNRTNQLLYQTYLQIIEAEGYDLGELLKLKSEDWSLSEIEVPGQEIKTIIKDIFHHLGINTNILQFDAELEGKAFEKQSSYQLWHLLYSYEGDNSTTGNEKLLELLQRKFGFKKEHAQALAKLSLAADYGSLSAKAIRKIYPFLKENAYDYACTLAGYNHSSSLTKEQIENRTLKDKLDLLPKNSLRNPVVEKILNQMVNLVNAITEDPLMGKPDEIRIELARELKKNAKERQEMTAGILENQKENERIRKKLINELGVPNPSRNDITRYKLYQELKPNGYKSLYSNTYIPEDELFSPKFDIEHIIPKSLLFDDSLSNKTICPRQENLEKGDWTAIEFVEKKFGADGLKEYINRIEMMAGNKDGGFTKAKCKKLLMRSSEIGDGFIDRDLRNTQYIAKRARNMLLEICRVVIPTTGQITDRLREDWGLTNLMQELNMEKYRKQGLTKMVPKKDGGEKEEIIDWTKRNDHRHHAMDALTVAFTKHNHIQYLNHLNARRDEKNEFYWAIIGIEKKETEIQTDKEGKRRRKFKLPMENFRVEALKHLESILVSYKAKNKVVTKNVNRIKTKNGEKKKTQLTPRGQLHKETVYGKIKLPIVLEERISAKFNEEIIGKVTSPPLREVLLRRLKEFGGDPKKAFAGKNSLDKNPIYLDEDKTIPLPEKVKLITWEEDYTIRKDITPDLKIEKVIDGRIRNLLEKRLESFNGDAKAAFSNLDRNPIWLNEQKGITVKRVTISGVKNAESLHYKRDHKGNVLKDKHGNILPSDYVSTGNNHHVAVYLDEKGEMQDIVVSFMEAVERARQGLPVVSKQLKDNPDWKFIFSMKQNECFVFPDNEFNPNEIDLLDPQNRAIIGPRLFRVQKLSKLMYGNSSVREYVFRHHLETIVEEKKELKNITYRNIKSLPFLNNIVKVRLNHLGRIVKVGEY